MRPFEHLTYLGQVRRLRQAAKCALEAYELRVGSFKLVAHQENATFRVDVTSASGRGEAQPYVGDRFLLRLHRPGYHSRRMVVSELEWLQALRRDARLPVPEPVLTAQEELTTEVDVDGVREPLACSLLRWMGGRFHGRRPRPRDFRSLGMLAAKLHQHTERWVQRSDFDRIRWDWARLFGDDGTGVVSSARGTRGLIPPSHRSSFEGVASEVRDVMGELDAEPDAIGLIHSDLHLGNVLFYDGEARAIDFDDCGFGYWAYDFAAPLVDSWHGEQFDGFRDALLDGYSRVRQVPEGQVGHLDTLIAARIARLALWATARAQAHPSFRQQLDDWWGWASGHFRQFLDTR